MHMPARPFLGPAAGEMGEEAARVMGAAVVAGLRGEEVEGWVGDGGDEGGEPGIVQVSATGTDIERSLLVLIALALLYQLLRGRSADPPRTTTPSGPTIVEQSPPEDKKDAPPANLAKPGEATLSEDRRRHILDGDEKSGGHGPGRNTPGKSEFPSDWPDEKVIDAVKDVANDPASVRTPADRGRTFVEGTRDGIGIRVIVGADGKAIVTAYPTNVPRNPRR